MRLLRLVAILSVLCVSGVQLLGTPVIVSAQEGALQVVLYTLMGAPAGSLNAPVAYPYTLPTSAAFDGNGNIWVADDENNQLYEFDSAGSYLGSFFDTHISGPTGLAVDGTTLWMANLDAGNVCSFSIATPGTLGAGTCNIELPRARSVAVRNGTVYASASGATDSAPLGLDVLNAYSLAGAYITGVGVGNPRQVALDAQGNVYVTGSDGSTVFPNMIYRFDSSLGPTGSAAGVEGEGLNGLAIDLAGNIYASNYFTGTITRYTSGLAYDQTIVGANGANPSGLALGDSVPEPGAFVLAGLGLGLVAWRRRRRA